LAVPAVILTELHLLKGTDGNARFLSVTEFSERGCCCFNELAEMVGNATAYLHLVWLT
jgi:hypothetical protein